MIILIIVTEKLEGDKENDTHLTIAEFQVLARLMHSLDNWKSNVMGAGGRIQHLDDKNLRADLCIIGG